MTPEITFAYNPATDTARIVGQGLERDYSDVTIDELPMTLDLVAVDLEQRRGRVKDYKFRDAPAAEANWQLKGGALALARTYDLDEVDVELIFLGRGQRRDRAVFTAGDLLIAAAEMREAHERAIENRARYARGEHVEPTEGPHCKHCPCAWSCPAKTGLIRAALGAPIIGEVPVEPAELGQLWSWIDRAGRALEALREQVVARVRERPVPIAVSDDGTETWLGEVVEPGDERLDPDVAIAAAAEVLGEQPDDPAFLRAVATIKTSKAAIERAIKDRVPRGQGAATLRAVLAEVRARGGASRPLTRSITTYTVPPRDGNS